MQTEIILSYYDESGRARRVRVESKRFTIGRIPDNDLMIDNSSLSRRHALIESFDDAVQISDCGSSNGTFLNGMPVTYPVDLHDGDVINLADACELTVEFTGAGEAATPSSSLANANATPQLSPEELLRRVEAGLSAQSKTISHQPAAPAGQGGKAPSKVPFEAPASPEGLNVYIIAPVAAVVILALVVVAAIALKGGGSKRGGRENGTNRERTAGRSDDDNNPGSSPLPEPDASAPVESSSPDPLSDELEEVERNALAVMRTISKSDPNPVLTEKNVKEINAKIKTYRGSATLRDNLRALKGRTQALSALAKSSDFKPAFVAFAALARMDRDGSRGDPLSVAQGMLPNLSKARVLQGDELAHDILLTLVSTDPSTGSMIGLRDAISALTRQPNASVQEIRNIWYLRDNQKITPQAYDLALRFLAIGAIAQNPRKYGIEAEPVTF